MNASTEWIQTERHDWSIFTHTVTGLQQQSSGCKSASFGTAGQLASLQLSLQMLSILYRTPWSSQHRGPWQWGTDDQWPLVATSLNPNYSWMHGRMALNDRAAPSVTVLWRLFHTSPLPIYHGCGSRTREGERRADSASQNAVTWTKGTELPWSTIGLFIH